MCKKRLATHCTLCSLFCMNLLLQIQNALGLSSSLRLVADHQTFVIVESSAGRCYSAEVTKRGQLRKNSVRVWCD